MKKALKIILVVLLVILLICAGVLVYFYLFKKDKPKTPVEDNLVNVQIALNPVGAVIQNQIDLSLNPVKIFLKNEDKTYKIVFDDNVQLSSFQNLTIQSGEYVYTILSGQLIFEDMTGAITIDKNNNVFVFNYKIYQPLILNTQINSSASMQGYTLKNKIGYYCAEMYIFNIYDILPKYDKTFYLSILIYDDNGELVEELNHEHYINPSAIYRSCNDYSWTPSKLISGNNYFVQIRLSLSPNKTVYLYSTISSFIWNSNTGCEIEWRAIKNNLY